MKKDISTEYIFFNPTKLLKLIAILLVLMMILTYSLICPIIAESVTLQLGTESFEGSAIPNGWYAAYGGNLSLSTDCAKTGTQSLKISNRYQAWHSPAINIYDTVATNGSGRYVIGFWVRTNDIAIDGNRCRLIIRGTEENSFLELSGNNYFAAFYPLKYLQPNQWYYLTSYVDIFETDIINSTSQQFNVMFDILTPTQNQVVYIDDFSITKQDTPIDYIYFDSNTYYLKPYNSDGAVVYATAYIDPAIAGEHETIRYSSNDTSVVTVNSSTGRLSALKAGTAEIIAYLESDPTIKATCNVEVGYQYYAYNYYDEGFKQRYGTDNAEGVIEIANNYVKNILKDQFDLIVTYDSENFVSLPDKCSSKSDIYTLCTSHSNSCTDAMNFYDDFISDNDYYVSGNTSTVVVWTGHETAWGDNTNRSFWLDKNGNGAGEIFMLSQYDYSSQLAPTYLHETAHALGALDHYHEVDENTQECVNKEICSTCGKTRRPSDCTMNCARYSLIERPANIFCSQCKQEINAHIRNHH